MLTKDFVVPSTGIHTHSFKKNTEDPLLSNITIKDWTDGTGTKSYDYLYNSKNSWEDYCESGTYTLKDEYQGKIKCVATLNLKTTNINNSVDRYSGEIVCDSYTSTDYQFQSDRIQMYSYAGIASDSMYYQLFINNDPTKTCKIDILSYMWRKWLNVATFEFSPEWITSFCCISRGIGTYISYSKQYYCKYSLNAIFSAV